MDTIKFFFMNLDWSLPILLGYSFLFFFVLKSNVIKAIKTLFIIVFVLFIITTICNIIVYSFSNISEKGHTIFNQLFNILYFIANSWLLVLISTLLGKQKEKENPVQVNTKVQKRNIGLWILFSFITLGFFNIIWIFKMIGDLKKDFPGEAKLSMGKAIGFCFIPLFNIFWTFYLLFYLPLSISRIEKKYFGKGLGFHFHPVFISVFWTVLTIFNFIYLIVLMGGSIELFKTGEIIWVLNKAYFICILALMLFQAKMNLFYEAKQG